MTQFRVNLKIALRIAVLTFVFVGPAGALAYANAQEPSNGMKGAGFVLYTALVRG